MLNAVFPHQHQKLAPQLLGPHRFVNHLEIEIYKVVVLRIEAMRRSDRWVSEVVQQRGLPDPAVPDDGTRLELRIAKPTEDLLNLTCAPEETARITDRITIGKRVAPHRSPPQQMINS